MQERNRSTHLDSACQSGQTSAFLGISRFVCIIIAIFGIPSLCRRWPYQLQTLACIPFIISISHLILQSVGNLGSSQGNLGSAKGFLMGAAVEDGSSRVETALGGPSMVHRTNADAPAPSATGEGGNARLFSDATGETTEDKLARRGSTQGKQPNGVAPREASDAGVASLQKDNVENEATEGRTSRRLLGGEDSWEKDMKRSLQSIAFIEKSEKKSLAASECASKVLESDEAKAASILTPLHEPYLTPESEIARNLITFVQSVMSQNGQRLEGSPFLPDFPNAVIESISVTPAKTQNYYKPPDSLIGFAMDIVSLIGQWFVLPCSA